MDVACGSAMKGIHPKSPNFYLVQKYTGDWTDALHICISAVELKSPRKSLAFASLPCEKMTALYYHANRCLSGMHPDTMRRQAAKRRPKGARRKDREAGCREATVGARRLPRSHVTSLRRKMPCPFPHSAASSAILRVTALMETVACLHEAERQRRARVAGRARCVRCVRIHSGAAR